jgi:uncharacterized membrane protein
MGHRHPIASVTDSTSPRHLRSKPLHREIELDFIRGIAILMVVDFHTDASTLIALATLLLLYRPLSEGRTHNWVYRLVA